MALKLNYEKSIEYTPNIHQYNFLENEIFYKKDLYNFVRKFNSQKTILISQKKNNFVFCWSKYKEVKIKNTLLWKKNSKS